MMAMRMVMARAAKAAMPGVDWGWWRQGVMMGVVWIRAWLMVCRSVAARFTKEEWRLRKSWRMLGILMVAVGAISSSTTSGSAAWWK